MKLSVVINTYNAEKLLARTLESVKDFDDILICDMYSTDSTVEIAKKYNARIIHHEKFDYVEPARNFAIQNALNQWVLLLDADELVSKKLILFLQETAKKNQFVGVQIPFKNYFMGRWMRSAYPDYHLRFFKKENTFWPPEIHSKIQINGEIYKIPKNRKDLAIDHIANDSVETILRKNNTYSTAEITRRKSPVTFGKLFFSPLFWFFKYYFIKGGILDGKEGFIFSCLKSHYKFSTLAKMYENKK